MSYFDIGMILKTSMSIPWVIGKKCPWKPYRDDCTSLCSDFESPNLGIMQLFFSPRTISERIAILLDPAVAESPPLFTVSPSNSHWLVHVSLNIVFHYNLARLLSLVRSGPLFFARALSENGDPILTNVYQTRHWWKRSLAPTDCFFPTTDAWPFSTTMCLVLFVLLFQMHIFPLQK